MVFAVEAVKPGFVGRVTGVDLRVPLSADIVKQLVRACDEFGLLIFPDQPMSQDNLIVFGERFGELDAQKNRKILDSIQKRLASDVVHDISNVNKAGNVANVGDAQSIMNITNMQWHTDGAYQYYPARYSILSAVTAVSRNGHTQFADTRAAYDQLDSRTRLLIDDMIGIFYSFHTRMQLGVDDSEELRNAYPPVRWPLVRTHPGSGRKVIYVDSKLCAIEGWTIPEGRALAAELIEHATQPSNVYSHAWTPGDVIMWDNRATLHRGRRFDWRERREMRRVQVLDDVHALGYADLAEVLPSRTSAATAGMAMA